MHEDFVGILSSGSVGNSIIVMNSGTGVMVDAGLSCTELERRLSLFGVDPTQIEALLLTHEHEDHIRGARRFCAVHGTPVYATRGTFALTGLDNSKKNILSAGQKVSFGEIAMMPFKVRHFAAEPIAFSVSLAGKRIGIATDLGSITQNVVEGMEDSDLLIIEANYDERMLLDGRYPDFLKRTIRGDHGHLSNHDAGTLSAKVSTERTKRIVLVHLSKENNTPTAAKMAVEMRLQNVDSSAEVDVSEHGHASGPYLLR